ncbi:MAG: DUF1566 domain-containing protein [Treponema sp.]|nr:DUF1566 domain-containing protein [Treponema sp.]
MKAYYYGVLPFVFLLCSCALEGGVPGPAGGYVFYDKGEYSGGWRYLECAPEDNNYSFGGYEDWYLPSVKELKWMRDNLYKKGMGNFKNGSYDVYLSSEEGSYVKFRDGDVTTYLYTYTRYTRTVRKF